MDLITHSLKQAFQDPGCPACQLLEAHEERFLIALLKENILDLDMRERLSQSQGLCHAHAWRLQAIEQERWNRGLGVAILYESLVTRVSDTLSEYVGRDSPQAPAAGRARSLAARLLPSSARRFLLARLSPVADCSACRSSRDTETALLASLARSMTDPEFRDWYQASDGLCLPHLRRAVDLSGTQASIRWLVEDVSARLDLLLADVREYVRKQDWNYREEARLDKEQAAWVRSVAFVVGEAPKQEKDRVYWLRAKARTDHELRPGRRMGERPVAPSS